MGLSQSCRFKGKTNGTEFMMLNGKDEVIVFTTDDIGNIRNTWGYVVEKGLAQNGLDMMIK